MYTYDKAGRKIKVTNTKQKVEYQFGKSYNTNTGLNNYGFRDYSSSIGRFITSDPIRDGTNWYTLAVNTPINFVDLWGLEVLNQQTDLIQDSSTNTLGTYQHTVSINGDSVILNDLYDIDNCLNIKINDTRYLKTTNNYLLRNIVAILIYTIIGQKNIILSKIHTFIENSLILSNSV